MGKHTPEPWVIDEREDLSTNFYSDDAMGTIIGGCLAYNFAPRSIGERKANAIRIVACVNACAGMDDPVEVIKGLKEALALTTHQVITCGIAARHPDPNLSRRECDYGGKWDSPQAESVRQLRQERDDLLASLEGTVKACEVGDNIVGGMMKARAAIAKAKGIDHE